MRKPPVALRFVIDPHAAHRIMDGGKDFHRRVARIDALEFLVDVEDAAQLVVERGSRECASDRDRRRAGHFRRSDPSSVQTLKISRVAISRGTRLPYFG